jgi:site-specific DNA recombinase
VFYEGETQVMKVALYARVSTQKQEKRGTIQSQVSALRKYAAKNDHSIAEEYVCVDNGYSGATLARPQLDRLRDGAQSGSFDAVLVLCPDRLSRKYAYLILILEEFERFGTKVLFVENTMSDDPQGALLMQIQGAVAEYERVKIAERHRRGRLHLARQGEVVWTSIPYGYRRVPRQDGIAGHLVINESEADIVRKIFIWHADENMTIRQIAKRLTNQAYPTPKGGKRWGETTVHRILGRESYLGTLHYNKSYEIDVPATDLNKRGKRKVLRPESEWISLNIPQIIDKTTFERSQQRHQPNSQFSPRNLNEEHWLLRRLVRCEKCGLKCACVADKRRPHMPPSYYYRCDKQHRVEGRSRCRPNHIRSEPLDDFVWKEIKNHLLNPKLLLKAHGTIGNVQSHDQSFLEKQLENVKRRIYRYETQKKRLVDIYQDGIINKADFNTRVFRITNNIDSDKKDLHKLNAELSNTSHSSDVLSRIQTFTKAVSNNIEKLTFHQKQKLARTVLKEVVIHDNVVKIYFKIPLISHKENKQMQPKLQCRNKVSSQLNLRSHDSSRGNFHRERTFCAYHRYLET